MTLPRILIAPHARELETPLGRLHASIVYDQFFGLLTAAGGLPLVAWAGTLGVDDLLAVADGVLLIGGGDVAPERFGLALEASGLDHRRDEFETRLVHGARARGTPLLAVCRGCQMLNVALGGTLRRVEGHRQEAELATPTHAVELEPGSRLAAATGELGIDVNSFHDWAAGELGAGLRVVAAAGEVAEAIEYEDGWWALGVQWHLELLDDPVSQRLFDAFVAAARA